MQVTFGYTSADPLLLDKRGTFTNQVNMDCLINNPVNTENPVFILHITGVFSYNYAYVAKWGKYYFLGEPTHLDGNRVSVSGVCDVLTSNADEIAQLPVNLARAGTKFNARMVDSMQPSQANRQCQTIEAKDSLIYTANENDIRYVLTVQGGAHR